LEELYPKSQRQYRCHEFSDLEFLQVGVLRCLSHAKSGHEFLQHHADLTSRHIAVDLFFKALQSKRRGENLASVNHLMAGMMHEGLEDSFAAHEELKDFDLYAADGHYHQHACHEASNEATGHFFRLNLRTHHLSHLDVARPADGKKREHDMSVIKRSDTQTLRNHARKGRKVILAWDKACINYRHWARLKHTAGVYFITREKANSAAHQCSENQIDPSDPRNEGLEGDYLVGNCHGTTLRRIIYTDPRDGTTYTYLTNEMTLPPSLLVLLYKHRWDIEKVFDQFKSKMAERKSWATGPDAKSSHANFLCLAHNLMLLFENLIHKDHGLSDELEKRRRSIRKASCRNREGEVLRAAHNFINTAISRVTQRTVRFIRWLRTALYQRAPLDQALARLAQIWQVSSP
jgi:hypothetical protein